MLLGFPGGLTGKESACNVGDLGLIPGSGRSPGGGHGSPLQDSCLENPHGQRSLVSYSPWGRKESDTSERLSALCLYYLPSQLFFYDFPIGTSSDILKNRLSLCLCHTIPRSLPTSCPLPSMWIISLESIFLWGWFN